MKDKLGMIKDAVKVVFSNPKYIIAASLFSFVIFLLLLFVGNITLFTEVLSVNTEIGFVSETFYSLFISILDVIEVPQMFLISLIAVLIAVNFSMIVFKFKTSRNSGSVSSAGGFGASFVGAFGAGCSACGTSLLALFFGTGTIAFFPFGGIELSIISLAILGVSLYFISKGIVNCETCKIQPTSDI